MLDSIFKSGQASDIVAINKILDKDAVAALIRDYGDDGVKVAVKGGDYLVKAINNLDDDAVELFVKTADGTILWSKVSSTGAFNIFTELAPCSSCRSVIKQFNRAYPGIVVNVYWK